MKNWKWALMIGLSLAASAQAAKMYSINGKVVGVSNSSVEIEENSQTRRIDTSELSADQKDQLKVGEQVTIWYSMQAHGLTRQQAGTVNRHEQDDGASDDSDIPAVQDDRAFYNAKIDFPSDPKT